MQKVWVNLGERSYPIHIGKGILQTLPKLLPKRRKVFVLTDKNVAPLHLKKVSEYLLREGFRVHSFLIDADEEQKNIQTALKVYEAFVEAQLGRDSILLALGGGMVGDIAGFCAATYMRGIDYVQIPTTLLAQIDSAIGGKTAVNLPFAKNIIGCFHQPMMVLSDIELLRTLPERQIRNAMAEAVKYGVIKDEGLFLHLRMHAKELMALNEDVLLQTIRWCASIKAEIVSVDERERSGVRSILNFGHTIGHALEAALSYKGLLHGEAVSVGMCAASFIAERLGLCSLEDAESIRELLAKFSLPTHFSGVDPSSLYKKMLLDKKRRGEALVFILPTRVGNVIIRSNVPKKILLEAIERFLR
jgi:3-dehydroquinate synthase